MNRDEAKFILRAYHLGGRDAGDPLFREALEMIDRDPELREWFNEEQAIDSVIARKIQSVAVPPDLKAQLLAARKVIPVPAGWQKPIVWAAIAATLALMLTLASRQHSFHRQSHVAEFEKFVANAAATLDRLDVETNNVAAVRQWLSVHGAPNNFVLPSSLTGRPSLGCRLFEWNGQRVSLVCFEIENRRVAHMFVINRAGFGDLNASGSPQFQTRSDGITTAAWSDRERMYVVAIRNGESELKRLLL
jgi:hypothetical protein